MTVRIYSLFMIAVLAMSGCKDPTTASINSAAATTSENSNRAAAEVETDEAKANDATSPNGKIVKTDDEWQKQLTEMQFQVTRKHATERAFQNEYWDNKKEGVYMCVCCQQALFDSETKFKSGTGWPSFYKPIDDNSVGTTDDKSWLYTRTEVHCSRCDAHLGHVFDDVPDQPTGLRYCINSASLKFAAKDQADMDE